MGCLKLNFSRGSFPIAKASQFLCLSKILIIDFPNTLFTKFGQINIETTHRAPIEHRRIIQALKARDQDWASMEMRAHDEAIRRGQRKLGEVFKKNETQLSTEEL